ELENVKQEITRHYEKFEFHLAGEKAYDYFWNTFANTILEDAKLRLRESDENAYYLLETILRECLKMLHPFMPFVTEAVYQKLELGDRMLMVEKW
ncbi:hypothetical protein LCGC14_2792400, partial [marine sediment metagenome]